MENYLTIYLLWLVAVTNGISGTGLPVLSVSALLALPIAV
jgi:hypothetical protein